MKRGHLLLYALIIIALVLSNLAVPAKPVSATRAILPNSQANQNSQVFLPVVSRSVIPTVISPDTKVLPPDTTSHLSSISPDGATYTFDQDTTSLDQLAPGSMIVSGPALNAPDGFLRKVSGVSHVGNQVIIQTTSATLEEAIPQGTVTIDQTLSPASVQKAFGKPGVTPVSPNFAMCDICFSYYLNDVILYQDPKNSKEKITANGKIDLQTSFHLAWETQNAKLTRLSFSTTTAKTTSLTVKAEWAAETQLLKADILVYRVYLAPIIFPVGVVPVVITPILDIKVGLDGKVSAGIETGINSTDTQTGMINYSDGNISIGSNYSNNPGFIAPKVFGELELKAYVGPLATLELYGVAGPWAQFKVFLKGVVKGEALVVPPYLSLKLSLYVGWEVPIGLRFEIFGKNVINAEKSAYGQELLLHEWNFVPPNRVPIIPSNPYPANGASGQSRNFDIFWTGGDPDGDVVTYTVYLQADNPNPGIIVSDGFTYTTYPARNLTLGKTYYWKIVAKDAPGAISTGPIWSFVVNNPYPTNDYSDSISDIAGNAWTWVTQWWHMGDARSANEAIGITK